jgi:hypothetical protein
MANKRDTIIGIRLQLLCLLKKKMSLSSKTLNHIKKYQITYKKVISKHRNEKMTELFQDE